MNRELSSPPATDSLIEEIKPQLTIAEADASAILISTTTDTTIAITLYKTQPSKPFSVIYKLPQVIKPLSTYRVTKSYKPATLNHLCSADPLSSPFYKIHCNM
ncbi:hypothetical protein Hanom_Chr16g01505841 [Helianthus anomalus]